MSATCAVALFGAAGLAIDIGRLYIIRNEAQGYADAAALSAAMQLNGTAGGLANADTAVAASPNKWNFGTTAFSGTVVEYSALGSADWAPSSTANAAAMRYARVTASVSDVPLFLLPVVGTAGSTTVKVVAVAGQQIETTVRRGLFPYSPIAHAAGASATAVYAADPSHNFGFTAGEQYDLKWPENPPAGKNCPGDNTSSWINKRNGANGETGEVTLESARSIQQEIADDAGGVAIALDQPLIPVNGDKIGQARALNRRVKQDGDTTSTDYASYIANPDHNGRRLITAIVNSGYSDIDGKALPASQQTIAVGFAQFLLLPSYDETGGPGTPWCAVYVGPDPTYGTENTGGRGNSGKGVSFIRLIQ